MQTRQAPRPLFPGRRATDPALLVAGALMAWLTYQLMLPFLASLAWALSFAVVAMPLHRWLTGRIAWRNVSAAVVVGCVAIVLIGPAVFVTERLAWQAAAGLDMLTSEQSAARWQRALDQAPKLKPAVRWVEEHVDLRTGLQRLAGHLPAVVRGGAGVIFELTIALLCLFFFLRDGNRILASLASILPLSPEELACMAVRVTDTIRATVFGTLVVAVVQGTLGGLMFWWLGLPSPLLWGVVMSALAIVPVLGTFVVWIPAAIYLAVIGSWGKALILAAWGGLVIATIDNLLYPVLVGSKMRQHTLAVFFSFVGGIALFGPSGLILGPLVLAVSTGLLEVTRRRMDWGAAHPQATAAPVEHEQPRSRLTSVRAPARRGRAPRAARGSG